MLNDMKITVSADTNIQYHRRIMIDHEPTAETTAYLAMYVIGECSDASRKSRFVGCKLTASTAPHARPTRIDVDVSTKCTSWSLTETMNEKFLLLRGILLETSDAININLQMKHAVQGVLRNFL